jgi:DNA-directed RNA polymerase specialized sigma24 family protein
MLNDSIGRLQLKEMRQAVAELPETFRNPFVLYFDGYKYNEIAGIMETPLGTIKSRIHFARKLLKAQIERY